MVDAHCRRPEPTLYRVGRARAPLRAARRTGGTSRAPSRRTATIGQVWTVSRPLVYRAITVLRELGYVEERGSAPSATGPAARPARSDPAGPAGVAALARPPGRARSRPPLRAAAQAAPARPRGKRPTPLLRAQLDGARARRERARRAGSRESEGLRPHRRGLAALDRPRGARVRRGAPRRAGRGAGQLRGDRLRQLGPHDARRDAAAARRRRLGPVADRPHRAAPRLPRRPRRLLPRLGDRPPARVRRLGRHGRPVPRRPAARDVRDPLAAPAEPDLDLALRARRGRGDGIVVAGARPPRRDTRARPEAVRAALRHSRGRRVGGLVQRPGRADLRAHLGRAVRAAKPAPQ